MDLSHTQYDLKGKNNSQFLDNIRKSCHSATQLTVLASFSHLFNLLVPLALNCTVEWDNFFEVFIFIQHNHLGFIREIIFLCFGFIYSEKATQVHNIFILVFDVMFQLRWRFLINLCHQSTKKYFLMKFCLFFVFCLIEKYDELLRNFCIENTQPFLNLESA